jgi:hypothetical protein
MDASTTPYVEQFGAELFSEQLSPDGFSEEFAASISATNPETNGAANDVPLAAARD